MKHRIYIALFLLLCIIPVAGIAVFGPAQPAANEILPSFPQVTKPDGSFNSEILREFSDYLSKRFALRQEMVTVNHGMMTTIFRTSPEEDDVIQGKDDWLFFGETLNDYEGIRKMSERELWSAAHHLALIQEYCQDRNIPFLFTIAPNKNSLYGEFMPDRFPSGEGNRNREALVPLLESEGVAYADLYGPIQEKDDVLYRKHDSHWTQEGAGLGADVLLDGLQKEHVPFYGTETQTVREKVGDLYEMLYPTGTELDEDVSYTRPFTFEYVSEPRTEEDLYIRTTCAGQQGHLLMFRDSFGNALHRFMAENFETATFCRLNPYKLSLVEAEGADTVIIELVERNLRKLNECPAIFPAPVRVLNQYPPEREDLTAEAYQEVSEEMPGYLSVTGSIGPSADTDSPVYLRSGDNLYEVTPTGDQTYAAFLPEETAGSSVNLLFFRDGQFVMTPAVSLQDLPENES